MVKSQSTSPNRSNIFLELKTNTQKLALVALWRRFTRAGHLLAIRWSLPRPIYAACSERRREEVHVSVAMQAPTELAGHLRGAHGIHGQASPRRWLCARQEMVAGPSLQHTPPAPPPLSPPQKHLRYLRQVTQPFPRSPQQWRSQPLEPKTPTPIWKKASIVQ